MHVHERALRDFNRRLFLKAAGAGAATVAAMSALGSRARALPATAAEKEQFLLDRITFGRNPAMVTQIRTRGYTGFLNWQLQLPGQDPIDDSLLFEPASGSFPGGAAWQDNHDACWPWGKAPYQTGYQPAYFYPGMMMWLHGPQLLMRGGWFGQHQLRWVMTDFLQNVHNTFLQQNYAFLWWVPFLKNVIWENALGNYGTLLNASSKGASMLAYLGQPDSDKFVPNQNYARELMELHSLGTKTYTIGQTRYETFVEADVPAAARILTGWDMVDWAYFQPGGGPLPTPQVGNFTWTASKHDTLTKTISNTGPAPSFPPKNYPGLLGPGQAEGDELIADLAKHPVTALNISRRLVQWFIGDDYEEQFYEVWLRVAMAYYGSFGDLRQTVKELFNETYFDQISPPGHEFNKVRRPLNKVVAAIRGLEAHIDYASSQNFMLQQRDMGQVSGTWPAPNGYQPQNTKWIGTMQPTVRFYYDTLWGGHATYVDPVTGLQVPTNGLVVADSVLAAIFPASAPVSQYAQLAAQRLIGGQLDPNEITAITNILTTTTLLGDKRRWALFFVLTSPSYQYLA